MLAMAWGVVGCASRSGGELKTSTGLPYWPPGPVTLDRPPASPGRVLPASRGSAGGRTAAVVASATPRGGSAPGLPTGGDAWRNAAARWQGTPYRLGGEDASGIDCSAYVRAIHREVSGLDLPRTTAEQVNSGLEVPSGVALMPGDIVFFRLNPGETEPGHAGVALGGGEFTHAGTSTGVTVARLDDPYWSGRWVETRRVRP